MTKTIAVIDYGSGNVRSVLNALQRVARTADLKEKYDFLLSAQPEDILRADSLILPGVGAFAACKKALEERTGLLEAINRAALIEKKPFLGICVGMQLLATAGYEDGVHTGLNYIPGEVRRFPEGNLKIPHISWARLQVNDTQHHLLQKINSGDFLYYVHSYHFIAERSQDVAVTSRYGADFSALLIKENIVGAQFHPEKSGVTGLQLLENFLTWNP